MILGQASGVAAAIAADEKKPVQQVPIAELQTRLKAQKAILDPAELPASPPPAVRLDPAKLPGIVVDDTQATATGDWKESMALGPYVGGRYLHDDDAGKGTKRVRFTPRLPTAGRYEVLLFASPGSNRATNVPVVVHARDSEKTLKVDQRKPREGKAISLGTFAFDAGSTGWVEIRTEGTDGHVIADAIQFLPVP